MKDCCRKNKGNKGFFQGIFYGLLPHSFCIAFVIFSVLGVTVASALFRRFLLAPYFFEVLIGLSFVLAVVSAAIYLKKKESLSIRGVRDNWGYLGILLGTTIGLNLLLFLVIFPAVANRGTVRGVREVRDIREVKTATIEVKIPCSGHASLIIGEIRNIKGVGEVKFSLPNIFEISYDPKVTNVNEILGLEIFKTYPATVMGDKNQGAK